MSTYEDLKEKRAERVKLAKRTEAMSHDFATRSTPVTEAEQKEFDDAIERAEGMGKEIDALNEQYQNECTAPAKR